MRPTFPTLTMALALVLPAMDSLAQDGAPPPRGPRPPQREGGPQAGPGDDVQRPQRPRDGDPGGPAGDGQRPPLPPIIAALDANHDGVIDEKEIAHAPAALRKLDKNGDGKLTMDELRPPRPEGGRPPGGQGGQGGPPDGGRQPQRRGPGFDRDGQGNPPPPADGQQPQRPPRPRPAGE